MASVEFDHVTKQFDETVAVDDLTLTVNEGEFLILVGPSGCGKTTALRMVAGLEEITDGVVRIGERVVNDLAPTQRDIAMVFQNYALYPHMSVYDNIAFPLRQQRVKRTETRARVNDAAKLLGITELLDRKPRQLSGGQRQRVAIGRALVRRPQAFLMDEPLSNLDAKLRVQMRTELLSLHQRLGITTIYVTHDQTEAMTLGDRVVVLNRGVVQQVDAPDRLYQDPANTFVAGFIGSPAMNLLRGELKNGTLSIGPWSTPVGGGQRGSRREGPVLVGLRPEDFAADAGEAGNGRVAARVELTEQLGPEVLVHFRVDGFAVAAAPEASRDGDDMSESLTDVLVARLDAGFHAARGDLVEFRIRPERVRLFDPESGESLARV